MRRGLPTLVLAVLVVATGQGCGSGDKNSNTSNLPRKANRPPLLSKRPLSWDDYRTSENGRVLTIRSTFASPCEGAGKLRIAESRTRVVLTMYPMLGVVADNGNNCRVGGQIVDSAMLKAPLGRRSVHDGSVPLTQHLDDVTVLRLDPEASKRDVERAMREIGQKSVVRFVSERRAAGDPDVTFAAHLEITSGALSYSCCTWPVVGTSVQSSSIRHPASPDSAR